MDFSKFCRQMRERGNKSVLIIAVMWNRIRIGTDLPCGRPPGSGSAWRMRIQIRIQEAKLEVKVKDLSYKN